MKNYHLIIIAAVFLIIILFIETTLINFPFVFLATVYGAVFVKRMPAYVAAFILGFAIDSLRASNLGITSLSVFSVILFLYLYERYFGSTDAMVATFVIVAAALIYTYFLSYSVTLLFTFYAALLVGYIGMNFLKKKNKFAL